MNSDSITRRPQAGEQVTIPTAPAAAPPHPPQARPVPYNAYPQAVAEASTGSGYIETERPPDVPHPLQDMRPAPSPPAPKPKKLIPESIKGFLSTAGFIVSVLLVAMVINNFVFQSYYVDGTSMEPTLQNNDRLIIDKTAHTAAMVKRDPYIPERGEIIVLDSSIVGANGHHEQLIKRVIGIPGDTVIVRDSKVTIKNAATPEGFNADSLLALKLSPTYAEQPIEVTLGPNELFVMGDNRAPGGSFDSREFGPINASQVEGRLVVRVYPFNRVTIY